MNAIMMRQLLDIAQWDDEKNDFNEKITSINIALEWIFKKVKAC